MPLMKSRRLRCFAVLSEGQWSAVCLDLSLAAQADSAEEAIESLRSQISSYVADAQSGGRDDAHGQYLMARGARLSLWIQYYYIKVCVKLRGLISKASDRVKLFEEGPLPA